MVAHPNDERYKPLFGTTVRTPLFEVEVPVLAHHLAEPDKGTGIAMICTFGDTTDVTWWRELNLPSRALIGFDGRMAAETPEWITTDAGRAAYTQLAGIGTEAGATQDRRDVARVGRDARRTAPDHPSGEVLRARYAAARDRRHPAVVHPQRRSRRGAAPSAVEARRGTGLASGVHAQPLPELGRRIERRLADQSPAILRCADPAVVPARRRRQPAVRRHPHTRSRPVADGSVDQLPDRFHRGSARQAGRVHR